MQTNNDLNKQIVIGILEKKKQLKFIINTLFEF